MKNTHNYQGNHNANAECGLSHSSHLLLPVHGITFGQLFGANITIKEAQLRPSSTGTPIARCNMTRVCCWKYTQTYTVSSAAGAMRLKRGMSRKMPGCLRLQSTGVMLVAAIKLETGGDATSKPRHPLPRIDGAFGTEHLEA